VQLIALRESATSVDLDRQRHHCVERMPDPPQGCASMEVGVLFCRQVLQEHDDLLRDSSMAGCLKLVEAVQDDVGARENSGRSDPTGA
jgi:hypothetical protein